MTKAETLHIGWLHCNDCHRAFENHNKLDTLDGRLLVSKSDLGFSFTSCGHFFCDNCIDQAREGGGRFVCKVCNESSTLYKVDGKIPKNLEVYIKPPVIMLEDAVDVMLFQLNNANSLIKSLRSKVAQQKELLAKAKQELTGYKALKERVAQLTAENTQLKSRIDSFISDAQDIKGPKSSAPSTVEKPRIVPPSPSAPHIKINGRLSLKSPIMSTPPTFRPPLLSSAESHRGFYVPEQPQTPMSAQWRPPARQTQVMQPLPMHVAPPVQQYYPMPQPSAPMIPYYQSQGEYYQSGSQSGYGGSPRPYQRRGSNDQYLR